MDCEDRLRIALREIDAIASWPETGTKDTARIRRIADSALSHNDPTRGSVVGRRLPFTEAAIQSFLDEAIERSRQSRDNAVGEIARLMAECYVEAFQHIRASIFGETKQ